MGASYDFDSLEFKERCHFDGELGAIYDREKTVFRLWAPTADSVRLRLFSAGEGGDPLRDIPLECSGRSVWSAWVEGDLHGTYYDYLVTVEGVERRTADPYARASGINGARSMVVDLRRTDPEGWEDDAPPEKRPETVIYELNVKDFSWNPRCGVPKEYRGKYKALTLEGTTLDGAGLRPTCLDYLKTLGITHVQLMPVFDFGSVDEGGDPASFNWGYDPVNYNVPEGSYATDPADGTVRIRQLKEAIMALHKSGLRVVMDVVYNHAYHLDSWLWRTAPGYYCRSWGDGTPSNGSGCGNDMATERSMCAKYIIDSVVYWAEEYHMDGFRFDLMGLYDVKLMNDIRAELDHRWGYGAKLMLGEPWRADSTAAAPGTALADKGSMFDLDPAIAIFNDATRDAIKGSLWSESSRGFANGGGLDRWELLNCLRGQTCYSGACVTAASQIVNYVSCHDDHTLWDKLAVAAGLDTESRSPVLVRQNRLAAAMYLMCQGNLFFLSGEEMARTKHGIKNTYRSPMEINMIDWGRGAEFAGLTRYYAGLIALRQLLPGLCDKSPASGDRIQPYGDDVRDAAAYIVDNSGPASRWRRLLLIYNAGEQAVATALPEGKWEVLANGEDSFAFEKPTELAGEARTEGVSALILGQR